jgi:hypothetical protein
VNDADVEATLRDIREQARAAARAAVADSVDERAAAAVPGPQPAGGSRLTARLQSLAWSALVRTANWMSRAMLGRSIGEVMGGAMLVRLGAVERSIGDVRTIAAGHEQRLHQLEEEQSHLRQLEEDLVRLRQMVLQLDEAAQLADRSRRGGLLRIEEIEARLGRQDTGPRRPTS